MKIELLTEQEATNIKILNECVDLINEKVDSYRDTIEDEVFSTVEKSGTNIDDLDNANIKINKLIYKYRNYEQAQFSLILSGVFLLTSILIIASIIQNGFELQNKWLFYIISIIGMIGTPWSIYCIIIRRKIKKNLKKMEEIIGKPIMIYLRY